jgi:hypothetical protein
MGTQTDKASRPLIAILPRWLVIVIAALALCAVSGLFVWAFLKPSQFEGTFARFILCLSIALYLGLFLFIIYPWGYRLTKIPYVDLSVEVVGPAALFIILFVFLLRTMPAPAGGRLHVFVDRQQHEIQVADIGTVDLQFIGGTTPTYFLVPGPNHESLHGIFVLYPENVSRLRATIRVAQVFRPQQIEFQRDSAEPIQLDLQKE